MVNGQWEDTILLGVGVGGLTPMHATTKVEVPIGFFIILGLCEKDPKTSPLRWQRLRNQQGGGSIVFCSFSCVDKAANGAVAMFLGGWSALNHNLRWVRWTQ